MVKAIHKMWWVGLIHQIGDNCKQMFAELSPQGRARPVTVSVMFPPMRGRPPKSLGHYPNRLREIRTKRGLSLAALAEQVGSKPQTLQRYETGERQLKTYQLPRLAAALSVRPEDILPPDLVPVVGRVGAGARVFSEPQGVLYLVRCPAGLDPKHVAAVEVTGDSMPPIHDGWLLFYRKGQEGVPDEALNQICVLETQSGETLVKELRRGYTPGRYNLISYNAAPRDDEAIRWASPVRGMLPRDLVDSQDIP